MPNRWKAHNRNSGLSKRVASQLGELSSRVNGSKTKKPKRARAAADRLEATVSELRAKRGARGRKPARSR